MLKHALLITVLGFLVPIARADSFDMTIQKEIMSMEQKPNAVCGFLTRCVFRNQFRTSPKLRKGTLAPLPA
jgi:hypothetical protein